MVQRTRLVDPVECSQAPGHRGERILARGSRKADGSPIALDESRRNAGPRVRGRSSHREWTFSAVAGERFEAFYECESCVCLLVVNGYVSFEGGVVMAWRDLPVVGRLSWQPGDEGMVIVNAEDGAYVTQGNNRVAAVQGTARAEESDEPGKTTEGGNP